MSGTIPSLTAGQQATITIVATVRSDATDGSTISNTTSVSTTSLGETNTTNNSASDTTTINNTGSISGLVYIDANRNGTTTSGVDRPLSGVTITLTGFADGSTTPISLQRVTDANGQFSFTGLRVGTYTLQQSQPTGFFDGSIGTGVGGGTIGTNTITGIRVSSNSDSSLNTFGEFEAFSLYAHSCWEIENREARGFL